MVELKTPDACQKCSSWQALRGRGNGGVCPGCLHEGEEIFEVAGLAGGAEFTFGKAFASLPLMDGVGPGFITALMSEIGSREHLLDSFKSADDFCA
jgi:hypothetical protein